MPVSKNRPKAKRCQSVKPRASWFSAHLRGAIGQAFRKAIMGDGIVDPKIVKGLGPTNRNRLNYLRRNGLLEPHKSDGEHVEPDGLRVSDFGRRAYRCSQLIS
jgi:hypothetical protein